MRVELKLDHRADCVVVILGGIVVDMRLGRCVAKDLRPLARRCNSLVLPHECPPLCIERIIGDRTCVECALEVCHDTSRPGEKNHGGAIQCRLEQECNSVGLLGFGGQKPDLPKIGPLPGSKANQIANSFVKSPVGTGAEQIGHGGGRITYIVVYMS